MLRLGASPPQIFQNNIFSCEFVNGFKIVLSWKRYGYAPTLCICYGESALAYKDCHCGHHLASVPCNHMSDLGRTWSWTHRLKAAIHLETGCNGHQERTWDLCGVLESGPGTGPVWRTVLWDELYPLVVCYWAPGCSVVVVGYMSYACAGSSCAWHNSSTSCG